MTDLTDPKGSACTFPEWNNNRGQIVGAACGDSALLWQHGHQYDLNTLVGPTTSHLTRATYVDDAGGIVAVGTLANGNQHVFLLKPNGHS